MDLFRKVLWSNSHLCCLEISSSVHRLAAAARSTCKHFTDTPAVQFSSVRIANTNQQQWHYLAETARPQPQLKSAGGTRAKSSPLCLSQGSKDQQTHKTNKHCTASCTSKPSSVSITLWSPIYTLQTSRVLHGSCLSTYVCLS